MKKLFPLVFWLLSIFLSASPPKDYIIKWQDEFDGETLDSKKWKLGWPRRWETINTLGNAKVYNGSLHISVLTEDKRNTSCILTTENILESPYGYWELRVKFSDVSGTWSDGWLYSREMEVNNGGAEVDIFEHRYYNWNGQYIHNIVSYGVHYKGYGIKGYTQGGAGYLNPCQEWHTFGLESTPKEYIWYIDGQRIATIINNNSFALFFIISTELQDWGWANKALKYYNHETMEVDYVRYYEKKEKD